MTTHTEASPATSYTIETGPDARLVVSRWDAPSGRSLVAVAPEYRDRRGTWHLAHSAVSVPPTSARDVAAALTDVAATIAGEQTEPPRQP